jgi:acetolactate synthase regulatory subunit
MNKIAIKELKRLLRLFSERPGAAVCSPVMEARADERHKMRVEIRRSIKLLEKSLEHIEQGPDSHGVDDEGCSGNSHS